MGNCNLQMEQFLLQVSLFVLHIHNNKVSCRILSWGGEQDGSMTIVTHESTLMHVQACGACPQENFKFRYSQIASDTIWDKIVV